MKTAAIIGCGRPIAGGAGSKVGWGIAHAHADGYREAFPGVTLHAVDPNAENLAAFAGRYGIPPERRFASADALYATVVPDCVSICTWPALHVPLATEAATHGTRAVLVEKPLGADGHEINELVALAAKLGTRVAVAHQRRYLPEFESAKALIADGVLGEKLVFEGRVGDGWDVLAWTTHWFDMANFLFDAAPDSVIGGIDHTGQRRYGQPVENASVMFAEYGSERQAVFVTGPAALPAFGVSVRGEKGMMQVGDPIRLWTTDGYREVKPDAPRYASAFAALLADLWRSVGGKPCRCDLSRCAVATHMAYAMHESARTQKRVSLPAEFGYAPLELVQHPAAERADRPLAIALLADPHHVWPTGEPPASGRDGLARALISLGHRVALLDARLDLAPEALDGVDALVLYHTQRTVPPSHRAVLNAWFAAGRPVVVSHCGIGAYADWPEFRAWIGRYWVWGGEAMTPSRHPHVPCEIRVDDPVTFAVPWTSAYVPADEMYQQLGDASPVRPLATAVSPDGVEELYAWQTIAHPNVVAWLPGHRADVFTLAPVRDGLAAALRVALTHAPQDVDLG